MTEIVVREKLPKNPIVVEAFPSKGFVSTIAASYMIRELGMKLIGHVDCDEITSITVIKDSTPLRPIRIYAKDNIVLIYSEVMVPFRNVPEISKAIGKWLEKVKPELVVLMAGIAGAEAGKGHQILGVASNKGLRSMLDGTQVKLIKDGVLTGVSSNILIRCMEKNIPTIGLMVETEYSPDAMAAASVLEILNKLLKTRINVETLRRMGGEIEGDFKKVMKQMKKGCEHYAKMEECGPMYG